MLLERLSDRGAILALALGEGGLGLLVLLVVVLLVEVVEEAPIRAALDPSPGALLRESASVGANDRRTSSIRWTA